MTQQVSTLTLIAATILILALVCGIIFFGVSQSKDIADLGYTAVSDTVNLTNIIMSIQRKPNMPAAAAYNILKEHTELFMRMNCHICGITSIGLEVGDCIKSHLRGRVNLTITEEESGGTYFVVLTGG
jgi:hypothetical protein